MNSDNNPQSDANRRRRRRKTPDTGCTGTARFRFSGRESVSDSVTDERKQPPSWRKLVNLRRANNTLVTEENLASNARFISDWIDNLTRLRDSAARSIYGNFAPRTEITEKSFDYSASLRGILTFNARRRRLTKRPLPSHVLRVIFRLLPVIFPRKRLHTRKMRT